MGFIILALMKKRIAIIGGGIAGLTFANCIIKNNFDIHIFEKKEKFGEFGAAISVFPNALCVMDKIGVLDKLIMNAGEIRNIFLKTSSGKILSKSTPKNDYPTICMHRNDLHEILLSNSNANLYNNRNVKKIKNLKNNCVELEFENGNTDIFDAVIGSDGINSIVREHIMNDGKPIFRGYNVWRGVVKTNFDIGYASETFGNGKRVGIVPIKKGLYGWWATANEDFLQDDEPYGTKRKLKQLFGNWHHPIPEMMQKTEKILKNSLCDRAPKKGWSKGNIILIGDAAHPTTPNLGQGGCIAIEGAYLLASCINKYGLTPKAYKNYEKYHFDRSKEVINESLKIGKLGQSSNAILIALRNLIFKIMPSKIAMKLVDKYFSYRVTEIKI